MGTVSNTLSSASSLSSPPVSSSTSANSSNSSSSSSSSGSTTFTGTSAYSQDLQNVINRAIQIADLPIQLLGDQQTALNGKATELTAMDGLLSKLQGAVLGIQQAMSGSSFTGTASDPSVVTATLADGAQEGVYPIEVQDIGSYAAGSTSKDWGTPAANATFSLVVGGKSYSISTTDTSATGVATAINQQYGNLVQATVLNAGSGSTADTRISLQAASLGAQTLDLQNASGTSLFSQSVGGGSATYSVPGTGAADVTTNSRSVVISPGVTLTMEKASPGNEVDVTVSRSTSTLSDALSNFADTYNAVVDEVAKQHGQNAGALQGEPVLQNISKALSGLGTYSDSGASINLKALGLDLDVNGDGHLTYTMFNMAATDIGNSAAVDAFLGNGTSPGFVLTATNILNGLEDSTTGIVKNAETDLQSQITDIGTNISAKQAAVATMTTNLENQMAKADSLLSVAQQQYTYMTEMFQAQQMETQQLSL